MIVINSALDVDEWAKTRKPYTKEQVDSMCVGSFSGKKHTTEAKKAISDAKLGSRNPNYKGCYYVRGKKFHSLRKAAFVARMPVMSLKAGTGA